MGTQAGHVAVLTDELLGVHRVDAVAAFLVRGRHAVHQRIGRPRSGVGAALRRSRHDLELVHVRGALAMRGAQAVGAGVATADDDHLLALGGDRRLAVVALDVIARGKAVGPRQVLHRLVDALEVTAWNRQIPACCRTAGQHHRVELLAQLLRGDVDTDVDPGTELGALGAHLFQAPVDVPLLHLELGDAVPQQPADAVVPLEHGDRVPGSGELLSSGQPGRPGTDDRNGLARQPIRRQRHHPALGEGVVDDLDLDLLDRDRILIDAQHARALTRRRTQPTGELGEIVGRVQPLDGVAPTAGAHLVVPLRDQVAQRTAVVAERDTAIHTTGGLLGERVVGEVLVDLFPVTQPQIHGAPLRRLPMGVLEKTAGIRHRRPP